MTPTPMPIQSKDRANNSVSRAEASESGGFTDQQLQEIASRRQFDVRYVVLPVTGTIMKKNAVVG